MKLKTQSGFVSKSVLLILLLVVAASYALINWRLDNSVELTTETSEQEPTAESEPAEQPQEDVVLEPVETEKTDEVLPESVKTEPANTELVEIEQVRQDAAVPPEQIVEENLAIQPAANDEKNYYLPPELDIGTMSSEDVASMMDIRPPDPNAVPPGEPPDPNIPPPGEPVNPYLPPPGEPASTIPPPGAEDGNFVIGTLKFAEPGKIIEPDDTNTTTN